MFCSSSSQSPLSQRIERVDASNDYTLFNQIEVYSIDGKLLHTHKKLSLKELMQQHKELIGLYIMKCTDHNGSIQTFRQLLW